MAFKNPIIPGFYSDPSVCYANGRYFMVHSSFEYFPGIPLFTSTDLVNWTQIGHVLDRPSQLNLDGAWPSGGLYAPTIREHDGTFYVICTNASHGGNFIVHTRDPFGPWSEPAFIGRPGIDPSLFFDDDGKVYCTMTGYENGKQGIALCEMDPLTGKRLTTPFIVWFGTGDRYPEGPHIYHVGEYYYLMIAEGGTESTHCEVIARAKHPTGPYTPCPHNPILTSRREDLPDIWGQGHGELIQGPDGRWWMFFHGYRNGSMMHHHMGRETCLAPVEWVDGWPVVNGGQVVGIRMDCDAYAQQQRPTGKQHPLTAYDPAWCWLRNPNMADYTFTEAGLTIRGGGSLSERISPSMYLRRQTAMNMVFETAVTHLNGQDGFVGISVFYNDIAHYDFGLRCREGNMTIELVKHLDDFDHVAFSMPVTSPEAKLCIECSPEQYHFFYGDTRIPCGKGHTRYVSTEGTEHSFTGVFFGLFVTDGAEACFHGAEETFATSTTRRECAQ